MNQQQDELNSLVERSGDHIGSVPGRGGPNDSEGNDRLYIKNTANGKTKRQRRRVNYKSEIEAVF